jgi:hypothetical protein
MARPLPPQYIFRRPDPDAGIERGRVDLSIGGELIARLGFQRGGHGRRFFIR